MKIAIFLIILASAAMCYSQKSSDNDASYPVDPMLGFSTGPQIGQHLPDFSLPDQNGEVRNIRDLLGRNGAIVDFFRSADW